MASDTDKSKAAPAMVPLYKKEVMMALSAKAAFQCCKVKPVLSAPTIPKLYSNA